MLTRLLALFAKPALAAPSMWGKAPAFGDFVHHNAHADDCEAWRRWFEAHPLAEVVANAAVELDGPNTRHKAAGWFHLEVAQRSVKPQTGVWGFALPPGSMTVAAHIPSDAVLVGAMAESCDKVGRRHPIVIWSALRQDAVDHLKQPLNWPYWLARLLAEHVPPAAHPDQSQGELFLQRQLQDLWHEASASLTRKWSLFRRDVPREMLNSLIDHYVVRPGMPVRRDVESEFGLRDLPWPAWPQALTEHAESRQAYFWQQGHGGKYLNCATVALPLAGGA